MSSPDTVAGNMEYIQNLFLAVREFMRRDHDREDLIAFLDAKPAVFRSVAYESASFEIALGDLSKGNGLENWKSFYIRSASQHSFHLDIGLGWAFANRDISPIPFIDMGIPVMRSMVFDGMGYYHGLFNGRKTVKSQLVPAMIGEEDVFGFDQGLGRRLWYISKGDPEKLGSLLFSFPPERRAGLWRGVGIACGYVGGNNEYNLMRLLKLSTIFKVELETGLNYAAMSRSASNSISQDIEFAYRIIHGKSLKDVSPLAG